MVFAQDAELTEMVGFVMRQKAQEITDRGAHGRFERCLGAEIGR